MNTLKLYLRSMKMLVRCQTEYPLSFLLNTLSQLIMLGGEMLAVVLLFDRFPSLGQWTGENVLFFFGLISTSFYLVEFFCRGITNFSPLVRSGALDHMLLRPRGVMTQVCCAAMDPRRIGALAVGAAALAAGARGSGVVWTVGKGVVLLESIACGSALVEAGCDAAEREIAGRMPGLYLTDRFSPGYGDMPLAQMREICEVLGAQRAIGLTVSAGGVMIPRKSVTAILGISDVPVARRPAGCEGCAARETCALRRR